MPLELVLDRDPEAFRARRPSRKRKWTYDVAAIARAARIEPGTVRLHIRQGKLHPGDLMSLAQYLSRRRMRIEVTP